MPARWRTLDALRGGSMLLLVIVNPLFLFASTPSWIDHAPGTGLHIADLIAPAFLFAVGLSYPLSLERRLAQDGLARTTLAFTRRYGILLLFGLIGEAPKYGDLAFNHWGVLESIGLCGLVVFPLMLIGPIARLIAGAACLTAWQVALWSGYAGTALSFDFGGPLAVLAWSGIVLAGTALAHARLRMSRDAFMGTLVMTAVLTALAAWGLSFAIPISKHLVTASYVLAGIATGAACLLALETLADWSVPLGMLEVFGKNSILIYIISGFETLAIRQFVPLRLPFDLDLVVMACALALCTALALALDARKLYLKI